MKLDDLHRRLARFLRQRDRARRTAAYSGVAIVLLWALAAAFLVDWIFQMDRSQRAVSLVLCAAVVGWAFYRYALPWLRKRETELEVALLVERQHRIDSDLVAAIQFERPEAAQWGSVQLERAVIDQAAQAGPRLQTVHAVPPRELRRKLIVLAVTLAVWAGVTLLFAGHVAAFFQRFLLSSRHYPTRVEIAAVAVNSQPIDPRAPGRSPVKLLFGRPLKFQVICTARQSQLPEKAVAEMTALVGGNRIRVDLAQVRTNPNPESLDSLKAGDNDPICDAVYEGDYPRLAERVDCQFYAGDAWTDAARLAPKPPPAVDVEPEIIPPSYVKADATATPASGGLRDTTALEGSRVVIKVKSSAPLREATISFLSGPPSAKPGSEQKSPPLALSAVDPAADKTSKLWTLDPAGTPLEAIGDTVRYVVDVKDEDDQGLERPVEGQISIQADKPPEVLARTLSTLVLPNAKPTIVYGAADANALDCVWMNCEVKRGGSKPETVQQVLYRRAGDDRKSLKAAVQDTLTLDLARFQLAKGDTVKVTIEARDYRGSRSGKTTPAAPLEFQVTDLQGFLVGAVMKADKTSAENLKTMIQKQLGIVGE